MFIFVIVMIVKNTQNLVYVFEHMYFVIGYNVNQYLTVYLDWIPE